MILIILAALIVGGLVGGAIVMGMRDNKQAGFFNRQIKDKLNNKEKVLKMLRNSPSTRKEYLAGTPT